MVIRSDEYVRITHLLSAGQIQEGAEAIKCAKNTSALPVFLSAWGICTFYKRELQQAINKYEEAMHADADYDSARYHILIAVQKEREGDLGRSIGSATNQRLRSSTFVDAYVELGGLLVKGRGL